MSTIRGCFSSREENGGGRRPDTALCNRIGLGAGPTLTHLAQTARHRSRWFSVLLDGVQATTKNHRGPLGQGCFLVEHLPAVKCGRPLRRPATSPRPMRLGPGGAPVPPTATFSLTSCHGHPVRSGCRPPLEGGNSGYHSHRSNQAVPKTARSALICVHVGHLTHFRFSFFSAPTPSSRTAKTK